MENFDWVKPSPFWQANGSDLTANDFFIPRLLEFKSDDFMEDFFRLVRQTNGQSLAETLVQPPAGQTTLKLYQPIHQRYYLVCASLCCREPGWPDRVVRLADGESVFFYLRKRVAPPNETARELGWFIDADKRGRWQDVQTVKPTDNLTEERLPLHQVTTGKQRGLLFGYVPTSSRATTQPAEGSKLLTPVSVAPDDRFDENITRTLTSLLTATEISKAQAQEISLFLLHDLDTFLQQYLPKVVDQIKGQVIVLPQNDLFNYFAGQKVSDGRSLVALLKEVNARRAEINGLTDFANAPPSLQFDLRTASLKADVLRAHVLAPFGTIDKNNPPTPVALPDRPPAPLEVPKLLAQANESFLVRCVYARPQCDHQPLVVSQPSPDFTLASAVDMDAPARQVRLELPRDVSVAALRQFKKGVGFVMSEAMRNKMARITGKEKELIKGDPINSEGGLGLGFICSFSFQIIFIIAFFLLIMFAVILNLVFWWMAFFRICLPIPVPARK